MTTSLAEQLQRLAVPQTSLLKQDKKRPSLLFDPREAAGLRRETVYQIGLDGIEELITKNSNFQQFMNNLFDISSKGFERAVQTDDVNKKLDKVIRKFLLQLSPYFLLSCSHKALEWLVNRFLIHEYNREDLLMLVLPYHESNIFVRVIQLMKFREHGDHWIFLKTLQKTGAHLTKLALLTHAANDVNFLKFVTKFMQLILKEHDKPALLTVPINFYCAVFSGAIEYSTQVNEAQISQMLPAMFKGLNSDIPDYCAASYVILSRLLTKISLSNVLLDKFVAKIAQAKVESLRNETVLMLLVLYQSQTHYDVIPDEACEDLVDKSWMIKILHDLNLSGSFVNPFVEPLLRKFLEKSLNEDGKIYRDYMTTVLNVMSLTDNMLESFIAGLLDAAHSHETISDDIKNYIVQTIETLERQYADQFDKEIYNILSSTDTTGKISKQKKCLQRILTETMGHRGKFDVFDKLYHPNPQYRAQAIDYLAKNLNKLRDGEKEMIKSSFIDRLNDDNVNVVNETLDLVCNTDIVEWATLKMVLVQLANKCQMNLNKWADISVKVVDMLCEKGDSNDWDIFLAIFPYLLPSRKSELKRALKIMNSKFVSGNDMLKMKDLPNEPDQFCNNIFDGLKNDDIKLVENFVETLQKVSLDNRDVLHKYFATLILSCILPENSRIEVNALVIEIFTKYFTTCETKQEKSNANYQHHINAARNGKFALEAFLLCLKNVIVKTQKPEINLGLVDFSQNNDFSRYFVTLAKTLFINISNYKKYMKMFLDYFCKNALSKIEFLLNLITCGHSLLDNEFEMNCCNVIVNLINEAKNDNKTLLAYENVTTPYLLTLLCHQSREIREKTFEAIEALIEVKQTECFWSLLTEIVKQKAEILMDEEQTPLVIFNVLESPARGKKSSIINKQRSVLLKTATSSENPIYLRANLLKVLSVINSSEILEETSAMAIDILKHCQNNQANKVESMIIYRTIMKFEKQIADKLKFKSTAWNFIEEIMKNDNLQISFDGKTEFVSVLMLNAFDEGFLTTLKNVEKTALLDLIIERLTVTSNPEMLAHVNAIFKSFNLDIKYILNQFTTMRDALSPKLDPSKLKRRKSFVPTVDILDTLEWRKGVTALELITDKRNISNTDQLLPVLFELLKKCLEFDEQVAVEYPKQLILSQLLHCCQLFVSKKDVEKNFNIELIVQCIRASQNPQTHHHALLLLAESASLVPSQVLHHIMAIFTFMGSSVLRHDDVYSYQIIMKIMDTIIPILLKDKSVKTISNVLRVFVDALLDVPEHRRMPLYKQLLDKIGADANLYVFLLLVIESHVMSPRAKDKSEESMRRLTIASDLSREYAPAIVIHTAIELMNFLKELPDEMDGENYITNFNIQFKTPKQFRHFKYTLITFMASLLSNEEFVTKVASLDNDEVLALEIVFKNMVINSLTFIQRISKVADKNSGTPQAQYWKIILHHSYDILDSVNALLNSQMFFLVIKGLMQHSLPTVQRRALELLNTKLQYNLKFFEDANIEEIYSLIPPLITIIKTIDDDMETDEEIIVQTALLSLKLLVKFLAPNYPEKFTEILEFVTDLMKCGQAKNNVLASLVLCLAELCVNLRANAIPSLPNFMPALLKTFKHRKQEETSNLLLMSSVTALQKIVDTLPLFLSPYLEKLLIELCLLTSRWGESTNDPKLQLIVNKLAGLRRKVGSVIPPRVLIPAVNQAYQHIIEKQWYDAIGALMDILGENFGNLRGPEIASNLPELTSLFLTAFQFRADGKATMEQANEVENHFVKAFTKLMLKLSESNFKPLFYKIFDWAVRSEVKSERLITFYSLCYGMADCLKGIFVIFVVHLLNNIAPTLDACNKIKSDRLYFENQSKNVLLLENILKTLSCVCSHATHRFITKERFEVLMQPLIDQLENDLDGIENLKRRNVELITPTIVNFVLATSDDFLWKQLNYQVLLKMRHSSFEIRLIALHCLTEIVKKLGEDFLPLIPETIPFLAELMEDEEEHVEKECKRAVQEMEKVLGESLQKYF